MAQELPIPTPNGSSSKPPGSSSECKAHSPPLSVATVHLRPASPPLAVDFCTCEVVVCDLLPACASHVFSPDVALK